jgi:LPS-assembly lipoprotein
MRAEKSGGDACDPAVYRCPLTPHIDREGRAREHGAPVSPSRVSSVTPSASARRFRWLLFSICVASVLAGCGWRLQGTTKLSPVMATTYIDTKDRYTDFNRALRDSLQASGARLTYKEDEATAVVKIIKDESGQRVLTVSARNTPEEYEVFYTIEYSVKGRTEELIAKEKLELTREYSYDETAVLAKQKEQSILREALARDLAGQVVRRLAAL